MKKGYYKLGSGMFETHFKIPPLLTQEEEAALPSLAELLPMENGDWPGDEILRVILAHYTDIIEGSGLSIKNSVFDNLNILDKRGDADRNPAWIALEWYANYQKYLRAKQSIQASQSCDAHYGILIEALRCMGIQEERMYWRAGIDPATRAKREALALQAQKNRLALSGDADGGRASANALRNEEAEEWREIAREVARGCQFGGARLEARINRELADRGFPKRSGPAIRKAIKGVRR
jgi:hypothetical protein